MQWKRGILDRCLQKPLLAVDIAAMLVEKTVVVSAAQHIQTPATFVHLNL